MDLINRDKLLNKERQRRFRQHNPNKDKEYREKNRELLKYKQRLYRQENPQISIEYTKRTSDRRNQRRKIRRKTDLNYLFKERMRNRIRSVLTGRMKKSNSTVNLLGCSIDYFIKYIENKFTVGMSWNKISEIHLDHIIPCFYFDLSKESEQKKCFHFTNIQPLWASDNCRKHISLTYEGSK